MHYACDCELEQDVKSLTVLSCVYFSTSGSPSLRICTHGLSTIAKRVLGVGQGVEKTITGATKHTSTNLNVGNVQRLQNVLDFQDVRPRGGTKSQHPVARVLPVQSLDHGAVRVLACNGRVHTNANAHGELLETCKLHALWLQTAGCPRWRL